MPEFNTENQDDSNKQSSAVSSKLGIITIYELFKLKQYSIFLDLEDPNNKRIQFSIDRLEKGLLESGFSMRDYTGEEFQVEKNYKIVNRYDDTNLKKGKKIISRTIKPAVLYNDKIIRQADIEVKIGTKE